MYARLLIEYLAERPEAPFHWADNNCCHFAARWVARATGRDPMAEWPPTKSAAAARRFIRAMGGDLAGLWDRCMPRSIPATQAQDGDLMLISLDGLTLTGGTAVAVCSGRHAITQDHTGATFYVTRDRAVRAWALE